MTHTPGQWLIQKGNYTGDNWLVGSIYLGQDEKGENVWVHITTDDKKASQLGPIDIMDDARLIAGAPDLLEALKEIAKGEGPYSQNKLTHAENTIAHMVLIASQAIARVEGTPSPDGESKP